MLGNLSNALHGPEKLEPALLPQQNTVGIGRARLWGQGTGQRHQAGNHPGATRLSLLSVKMTCDN